MRRILNHPGWCLAALLLVALAVRLAAGVWWQSRFATEFAFGDSDTYWCLGRTIARGEDYQYHSPERRIFRTPGYPLLLSLVHRIDPHEPSVMWGRALSAVLGTIAVAGVCWLGVQLFDPPTGLLAALAATIDPATVSMGAFVLSEALFCPLLLAQLLLSVAAWRSENTRPAMALALCAGLMAGGATLVRPSWLLFTPLACVTLVMVSRRPRQYLPLPSGEGRGEGESRKGVPSSTHFPLTLTLSRRERGLVFSSAVAFAMLLGLCLAMTPWWIRSYRIAGRFIPTTLQVGASLYDGLSPQADGSSEMSFVTGFEQAERNRRLAPNERNEIFEYRVDQRMRDAALDWARTHPGQALKLAGVKFLRIWNLWPNERGFANWPLRLVVAAGYLPMLIFALWGIWKYSRLGWPYVLCWLPAVYFTMLHVIFVGSIRYRQPAMLPLMVLAAAACRSLWMSPRR